MKHVKVIDSMPSTGKTCYMIEKINQLDPMVKVIYITPLLTETNRIQEQCKKRKFQLPDTKKGKGSKQEHFKELLKRKANISSTHALFSNIDNETIQLIRAGNYILVLDEVLGVFNNFDIYNRKPKPSDNKEKKKKLTQKQEDELKEKDEIGLNKDMKLLISNNFATVDSYFKVTWNNESEDKDAFYLYEDFKQAVDNGQIYFVSETYLLWMFPPQVFQDTFKEIYILTYQFDYQIQSAYFKFFDIPYEKYGVIKYREDRRYNWKFKFVDYLDYDNYRNYDIKKRKQLKELITICDSPRLNEIGTKEPADKRKYELLSWSNYDKMDKTALKIIQTKSTSYLNKHLDDKTSTMIWTTFKDYKGDIRSSRMPVKDFVSLNARATNEYRDKTGVIYLVNRFQNPFYSNLFKTKGISIDKDGYALAEMLQFIFRTAIREDTPIKVFVPSERMRLLLISWLDGQY